MFSSYALTWLLALSAIRSLAFRGPACIFFFFKLNTDLCILIKETGLESVASGRWRGVGIHRQLWYTKQFPLNTFHLSSSKGTGPASSWIRKALQWEIVMAGVSLWPFSFLRYLPFPGILYLKNLTIASKLCRTLTFPVHVLCIQSDFRANWMDFFVQTRLSPDR